MKRIALFRSGAAGQRSLLKDLSASRPALSAKQTDDDKQRLYNQARCIANLDRCQVGKAASSFMLSGGIAELTEETVEKSGVNSQ
jgi:hypothetical protein